VNYGYLRVAAATHAVKVADVSHNTAEILKMMTEAAKEGVSLLVFPELAVTGYTCNDLFLQNELLDRARAAIDDILAASADLETLVVVGFPFSYRSKLYNCAAVICKGRLLGIVTKRYIPNYAEFYEARYFTPGTGDVVFIDWNGEQKSVPFGGNILFRSETNARFVLGVEICEDVWMPHTPSTEHALAGATVIANASASDEVIGKAEYRRQLILGKSATSVCAYVYCNAGVGESTQDLVFAGHNIIGENGAAVAESGRFANGRITGDVDLEKIESERRKMTTFRTNFKNDHVVVPFVVKESKIDINRRIDPRPFVPAGEAERNRRCEEILNIQSFGLRKRLAHTNCKHAILGISGGLDSTLALLVTRKAFALAELPAENIIAVTMPAFGTTDRTYNNALKLIRGIGATCREINIKEAIMKHFSDIGHDPGLHDVTYENSQARERTQILMDLANAHNGLVIGTGDMSELALGWATYNGDHMSMYGVNCSVPKTLVRHLVRYYADTCGDTGLAAVLTDVLETPVSPELLPPEDGKISQKTEDLIGPYELHDFFLYQMLRFGFAPRKVLFLAESAFAGRYERETILHWLETFYRRFFAQQYKRSCLPDGPKVGSVALSPRGDLRMASDSSARIWLDDLDNCW